MQTQLLSKKSKSIFKYMLIDVIFIFFTYFLTMMLFDFLGLDVDRHKILTMLPFLLGYKLLVYTIFGFYTMLVKHFGLEDLIKMIFVIIFSNIFVVVLALMFNLEYVIKTSFIFITPLEIGFIVLPRIFPKLINYFKTNILWGKALGKRTLIIGAGAAGEMVVKEVYRNKELNNIPVAFVDDDPLKIGSRLMGIKIVGPVEKISQFIKNYQIDEVILAINHLPFKMEQEIIRTIANSHVKIKKLISLSEMSQKHKTIIREVAVEDLLNRDPIVLDNHGIKAFIENEIVLVTGGGGSIGSELCRQIVELKPKLLVIFDIYENNAYDIQMEIQRKFSKDHRPNELHMEVIIGSVYNYKRLEEIYKTYRPTIVFHAAAYKHVPLMEDSAKEAVRTNVMGTYNASVLANKYRVKKFVLVSSDKAVRSTNIMGATKRFAEMIVQSQNKEDKCKFSAVRFGNVLGSNGSVIPLFKKQIADGGPITVTHKEITRYFMTIPEAVGLILQSAVYANGGEIFILDMGEPVKIKELAEKMVRLAGFKPYEDIDIEFTGLRPGEKLFEELLVDHNYEEHRRTPNDKIYVECQKGVAYDDLHLDELFVKFEDLENDEVKEMVSKVIKTYKRNGIEQA